MKSLPLPFNPLTQHLHKMVFFMDKQADQVLQEKLDLSFSQFRMLIAIHKCEKATQVMVANFHTLTAAAVSRQVTILKRRGLITIETDPGNRRQHFLALTSLGKQQLTKGLILINKTFDTVYASITQAERTSLERILEKIVTPLTIKSRKES